jgi:hypothetical protein
MRMTFFASTPIPTFPRQRGEECVRAYHHPPPLAGEGGGRRKTFRWA